MEAHHINDGETYTYLGVKPLHTQEMTTVKMLSTASIFRKNQVSSRNMLVVPIYSTPLVWSSLLRRSFCISIQLAQFHNRTEVCTPNLLFYGYISLLLPTLCSKEKTHKGYVDYFNQQTSKSQSIEPIAKLTLLTEKTNTF